MTRVTKLRRLVDDGGVEWVRRGETMEPRRVRRLLLHPDNRVVRFGGPQAAEVAAADREAYWRRIEPYVMGKIRRIVGERTDDHFDCEVVEFRNAERQVLLAVYESC